MTDSVAAKQHVSLRIPANPSNVRLARVIAAALADEAGFDYDEVEDLRIAIDELCFAVLDAGSPVGDLELIFHAGGNSLQIEGSCRFAGAASAGSGSELMDQILGAITDEHDVSVLDHSASFRMSKTIR